VVKEVPTVEERISRKIESVREWREANPGISYVDDWHPEDEPKIYIQKELLYSLVYRSLSRAALLVYQDFLAKRVMRLIKRNKKKYWCIENNGKIIYPYSEAENRGISRKTFVKAIDELQRKGFIDITHLGKGGRKPAKGTGDVTTYMIDDRWRDYGTLEFRPPRKPRRKDKRKGRGFALIWKDEKKANEMVAKRNRTILEKRKQI
jgi:hypothetical protein